MIIPLSNRQGDFDFIKLPRPARLGFFVPLHRLVLPHLDTTALAVRALIAAGQDPAGANWTMREMDTVQAKGSLRFHLHVGRNKAQDIVTLSLAAAAAGVRIYIARFLADGRYEFLEKCSLPITVRYFDLPGLGVPRFGQVVDEIITESSLRQVKAAINSGEYDLVILDEVKEALARQVLEPEQVYRLLQSRPAHVEIALA